MTAKPSDPHVGLVVEGAGDVLAVPIILRRHLYDSDDYADPLGKPVPVHGKGNAMTTGGIEGYVMTAALRPGCVGVLVVLDGDKSCVAHEGPTLRDRAKAAVACPVVVTLAEHNFEDWLYASVETLEVPTSGYVAGSKGLHELKAALAPKKYVKPVWQPRLASRIDLALAGPRSASLSRLLSSFDQLRALVPGVETLNLK